MVGRKPKRKSIDEMPVEFKCPGPNCSYVLKVPHNKFSAYGGTYICKGCKHEVVVSPEYASEILAQVAQKKAAITKFLDG